MENTWIGGAIIPNSSLNIFFQLVGKSYIDGFAHGKGSVSSAVLNIVSLSSNDVSTRLGRRTVPATCIWNEVPATVRLPTSFT
jgi:hypothetical protein